MKVARRATGIFNAHPNRTQCTQTLHVTQTMADVPDMYCGRWETCADWRPALRVPKPYPSEPKPYPDQTPLALSCALMHASAQHCGISDQTLPPPPPAEAHANKHKEWEGGSLSRMPLQGNQYPGLTLCSSDLNFKLIY